MGEQLPNMSVTPDDVLDVGRFAYQMATNLRSSADALDNEVSALLTSWKGSSATSYAEGWRDMFDSARLVWDELFQLAEKLGITADMFRAQDTNNAGEFSSLDL
ncbi:WXG100 family type VII secretion target [Streptomyces gardneri]|nr:WXG100 family type VII secretion target [Streptomyces gardneri]